MKCKVFVLGVALIIVSFFAGCGSKEPSPVSQSVEIEVIGEKGIATGQIAFNVRYVTPSGKAAKIAAVDTMRAYVYESDGTKIAEANLEKVGDRGKASITVTAGDNRKVDLVAYDQSLVNWFGSDTDVDVVAGQTTTAEITMESTIPILTDLPDTDTTGTYTVSWGSVSGGTTYTLEENETTKAYKDTSVAITEKPEGSYSYRVKTTVGEYGDSPWSTMASIEVARQGTIDIDVPWPPGQGLSLSIEAVIPPIEVQPGYFAILGLTLSPDESKLYAAYWTDSSSDPIAVYSTTDYSLLETMSYGRCHSGVAVSQDDRYVFTPSYYQGVVSRFDQDNGNARTYLSAGSWSQGIAISPDGTKIIAYAGCDGSSSDMQNDAIYIYGIASGDFTTLATVNLVDEPQGGSIPFCNDENYVYVPTRKRQSAQARLYEISIAGTYEVSRYLEFPTGSIHCATGNNQSLFVSDREHFKIWIVDRGTWSICDSIEVPYKPCTVVMHPSGKYLFVVFNEDDCISVFDATTKEMVDSIGVNGVPHGVVFTHDGRKAYVDTGMNGITVLNISE